VGGIWSSRWSARPGGRERSSESRRDSRSGGRREAGWESRSASARSGSAAARMGPSGRDDTYQSKRSREVAGVSGSARRRARRRGVSECEASVARRRERSNGASRGR
jgi:hypothetical protein